MDQQRDQIYAFGPFRIDGSERQLLRDGVPVPLPPKVFDVLLALVEEHGHIVSKDELMRKVWADTFVEDANLTVSISALRRALGEDGNGSRFIETVPKHGYRFTAAVVETSAGRAKAVPTIGAEPGAVPTMPSEATAVSPRPDPKNPEDYDRGDSGPPSRTKTIAVSAIVVGVLLITAFAAWSWMRGTRSRMTAVEGSPIASVAVLPFENGVQDVNAEYLSDGITESLINRLSQLSGLKVASPSSSFRYKGKDQDIAKIGEELSVRAVLTGSVRQMGDQLVIVVRLDDASTDQHIWGEQYIRPFTDIITVQNEIAQDVTSNLRLKLTGEDEQKLAKKYTQNPEAYQLYLKGNYEWNKHTKEDVQRAIGYYEQAREIDPNYALAYAGLSGSYGFLGNAFLPPNENFPQAKAYAAKALELDDTLPEPHTAMGAVLFLYDWDWAGQEKEFKRAQSLNPNQADAHALYAAYLEAAGRFDEAREEAKRAQAIDPLSAMFTTEVGFTYYFARDYDEAIDQFKKVLGLDPHYVDAYQYLGQSYEQKKMYPQAIATFQKGMAETEHSPALIASLGHACALAGDRAAAAKAVEELRQISKERYTSPYFFAVVSSGLGDKDEAFKWLEKAFNDRATPLIWIKVEPQFDPIRSDPRFGELLGRIGLN